MATVSETNSTITEGGAAQELLPADADRAFFEFQNNSSGDLWISFLGDADVDQGFVVKAGGYCSWTLQEKPMINRAASVYGDTTGQAFYVGTDQN